MNSHPTIRPRAGRAALALAVLALVGCTAQGAERTDEAAVAGATALPAAIADAPAGDAVVTVYKSPTCGCCANWVEHMRENGFDVEVHDMPDVTPVKELHGVPGALQSCHTALVGDYVVEGHVPADLVRRLLAEQPQFAGIAVPGMPIGSPGMEGVIRQAYNVVAFRPDGTTEVYARR